MSLAAPKRSDPQVPESILFFRDKYAQALEAANVSAEHTATSGWQQLYAGHAVTMRESRRELAKQMKELAKTMEDSGLTEDEEKSLSEIKKSSAALREADHFFLTQTVGPVREPVLVCDGVRREAINEARRDEAESPLTRIGALEEIQAEVAGVRKPRWDQESGRVIIDDPDGLGE